MRASSPYGASSETISLLRKGENKQTSLRSKTTVFPVSDRTLV